MAFTTAEKLSLIKEVFRRRIDEVETLAEMAQLINNISPAGVKAFLNSKMEGIRQARLSNATREGELAADLDELKSEVANL